MDFAVDWNAVCLVCLQEGDMKSIFEKDEKNMSFCDKIMHCSSIEIQRGTNLPEQICSHCIDDLNAAYRFRTNCESTNIILKSFLNSTITDLELPTSNGQVYKYKLPTGLNVKRIKSSSSFDVKVKEEHLEEEDDQCQYEDHFAESDEVFNEKETEEENVNFVKKAEEISEDRCEGFGITDDLEHFVIKSDKVDTTRENQVKQEINTEQKEISQSKRQSQKDKRTPKTKMGRPRSNIKQTKLAQEITPDNVSAYVQDLTTVTYVRKNREDEKPLKICDICGNGYKYQHALESHMRRHRNERPFSCEFCERAFVANVELRRHMRVHTGQKPYACRYCNRRFSDFGSRIKHERTHTGERPYECTTCGKAFAYAHVLSVHILTHTGEKKFKCEVCGKGFTKKVYLKAHMRLHNEIPTQQMICEIPLNEADEHIQNNQNIQEMQMLPVLQYTMETQNPSVKVENINLLQPKTENEEVEIVDEYKTAYVSAQ